MRSESGYVVVTFNGDFLMPSKDAAELMRSIIPALTNAERVTYEWSTKCYRPYDSGSPTSLAQVFSVSAADLATLRLEE